MNSKTPKNLMLIAVAVLIAVAAAACSGSGSTTQSESTAPPETPAPTAADEPANLQTVLDRVASDDAIPAIGATVFSSEATLEQAVAGVRRLGATTSVTADDKFHLGSDTKAMTAALVGRLAERGEVDFDLAVPVLFPDVDVDSGYEPVTMRNLLSHTAGIDDAAVLGTDIGIDEQAPISQQRIESAAWLFSNPPQLDPGTSYMYSNVGYVMAAAALELTTGASWEDLIVAEVFEPLGMESCGLGAPEGEDQPWGHSESNDPVPPGPLADNHPVLSPAGRVHCTMDDWVTFLQEMLLALDGRSDFLTQATAETIFTPMSDGYALGWGIFEEDGLTAYTHDGSNTMWYASAWLVPEQDLGWVIVSNASIGPGSLGSLMVTRDIDEMYLGS